jgi:hypothetical protein
MNPDPLPDTENQGTINVCPHNPFLTMQNYLYFLPSHEGRGEKKTFFLFEYAHDGTPKSDQIKDTDKAVSIIKTVIKESTRNIVLDTHSNSGRNLLMRVMPDEATKHRFFLASLYRSHCGMAQDYWKEWSDLDFKARAMRDLILTKLFQGPRTLGGMRPLTQLDQLVLRAWSMTGFAKMTKEEVILLLQHPIALLLSEIAHIAGKHELPEEMGKTKMTIAAITHCFCRLLQDPFPCEQEESAFTEHHSRLFDQWPPGKRDIEVPAATVSYFFRHLEKTERKQEILRKYRRCLWDLLTHSKAFLEHITDNAPIDSCMWFFRRSHDFESCFLHLLDLLMQTWTEVLVPGHGTGSSLNFIDHEVFIPSKAPEMFQCCRDIVQRCRKELG